MGAGTFIRNWQMGGSQLSDSVTSSGSAVDSSGNVYFTGGYITSTGSTVSFGTITKTSTVAGRSDFYVAKFGPTGTIAWVSNSTGTGDEYGQAVAVDSSANVYVAGRIGYVSTFSGTTLTPSVGTDGFLAKYNSSGTLQWIKQIGGTGYEQADAVVVDSIGNVYVAGKFSGTVNLGGSDLTTTGGYDLFIAKYNTSGTFQWSKQVGGASVDSLAGMAIDGSSNIVITGYFQGTSNFGGANLTSAGGSDVFVARYNSAGTHLASARYGDSNDQRGYAVACDSAGNIVLTGYMYGSIDFGVTCTSPGAASASTCINVNGADIYLVRLGPTLAPIWAQHFGTTGGYGDIGKALAIDSNGNIILVSDIVDSAGLGADFGGGPLIGTTATYDPAVAKFSAGGVHQWSKRFSAPYDDHINNVALNSSGQVYMSTEVNQQINCGGGDVLSPGGTDSVVCEFQP